MCSLMTPVAEVPRASEPDMRPHAPGDNVLYATDGRRDPLHVAGNPEMPDDVDRVEGLQTLCVLEHENRLQAVERLDASLDEDEAGDGVVGAAAVAPETTDAPPEA